MLSKSPEREILTAFFIHIPIGMKDDIGPAGNYSLQLYLLTNIKK